MRNSSGHTSYRGVVVIHRTVVQRSHTAQWCSGHTPHRGVVVTHRTVVQWSHHTMVQWYRRGNVLA